MKKSKKERKQQFIKKINKSLKEERKEIKPTPKEEEPSEIAIKHLQKELKGRLGKKDDIER